MTKSFFLFCCIFLFSHICEANIIIDIDVKIAQVVPNQYQSTCPPSGCSIPWVENQRRWISICAPAPSHNYMPFTFRMVTQFGNQHFWTQEATSTSALPGLCLTIPGVPCNTFAVGGSTLWLVGESGYFGKLRYTLENGYVVVSLHPDLLAQGYTLRTLMSVEDPGGGGQNMQSGSSGSNSTFSVKGLTADRNQEDINESKSIIVSPNPFLQNINIQVSATESETVNIQLLSANSQILRTQTYAGGQEEFPFPTQDIPLGIYFLRVQAGERVSFHKVVKSE